MVSVGARISTVAVVVIGPFGLVVERGPAML